MVNLTHRTRVFDAITSTPHVTITSDEDIVTAVGDRIILGKTLWDKRTFHVPSTGTHYLVCDPSFTVSTTFFPAIASIDPAHTINVTATTINPTTYEPEPVDSKETIIEKLNSVCAYISDRHTAIEQSQGAFTATSFPPVYLLCQGFTRTLTDKDIHDIFTFILTWARYANICVFTGIYEPYPSVLDYFTSIDGHFYTICEQDMETRRFYVKKTYKKVFAMFTKGDCVFFELGKTKKP